jgi:RNA recognition motif-containing protein
MGEYPSRTLFVRNINIHTADEELLQLFQQHGEIRSMYTACKHRGFVMMTYYDIRAATRAKQMLQVCTLLLHRLCWISFLFFGRMIGSKLCAKFVS